MSENTTATVETVTAEVRVLMVGSRQVTASVYSQLDLVEQGEITPFGRVAPKDAHPDYVYVIGRKKATGELTRCFLPVTMDCIKRWAAARSQARTCRGNAEDQEDYAARCHKAADEHEKTVAELSGDGFRSASYNDISAEKHEAEATEKDGEAAAAESETSRLELLADAAVSRRSAAQDRYRAAQAREEISSHREKAANMRQAAKAAQDNADDLYRSYEEWAGREDAERENVAAVSAEWSELPLIVLAGLR